MKDRKKGFTLIEIIVCLVILMAIVGIFSVNFITNLNSSKERLYKEAVTRVESASDAYVAIAKNDMSPTFDDIKLVMENEGSFSYITIDELDDNGLLGEKQLKNPKTGKRFEGIIKFTNDGGVYDFEYIENPTDIITLRFERNGADSITRSAQAFICHDKSNVSSCVKDMVLPSITRIEGRTYGWSLNYDAKNTAYKEGTKVADILSEEKYDIIDDKIRIYAITSKENSVYFDTGDEDLKVPQKISCTIYNTEPSCSIALPDYTTDEYHEKKGWSTNESGTADNYEPGSNITIDKTITLYVSKEVKGFDILINKLNRISSTTVIPSNINIILVLDVSGSMGINNRIENLKKVTTGLADRINYANSTVSIVPFSNNSIPRLTYCEDRLRIKSTINKLNAYGGTNFVAAIKAANQVVKYRPNDKPCFIILVSDGYSSISFNDEYLNELKSKAEIYTMGLGYSADSYYLRMIASKPENFYSYDEYSDTSSLTKFYELFDDIVQDIMITEGDGLENAIKAHVKNGKLELGNLVISDKYPLDIYIKDSLLSSFTSENQYFYRENGLYYFDVYNFALSQTRVGLANMNSLRIKFFYTEDK